MAKPKAFDLQAKLFRSFSDPSRLTILEMLRAGSLTALYNIVGLALAALGFLPPIFAADAQSLPDLGMLANSARLIRQK